MAAQNEALDVNAIYEDLDNNNIALTAISQMLASAKDVNPEGLAFALQLIVDSNKNHIGKLLKYRPVY
jgi:hypothetical protein